MTSYFRCSLCAWGEEAFWTLDRLQPPTERVDVCMRPRWKLSTRVSVCPTSRFLRVAHLDAFCMFLMRPYINAMRARRRLKVAAGRLASLRSPVIRPGLRLTRAHQEIVPRPSFPLQSVEMRSLHNIYPGNNDVWFDSLLGVSLRGLFSSTAATERENRQKLCPQERTSLRSLFMDDARLVYFCARPSEWKGLLRCAVGSVTHCWFLSLLHSSQMLLNQLGLERLHSLDMERKRCSNNAVSTSTEM